MEKINVSLYGGKGLFGGRETPLEADIIYCDKHETCSFYKKGLCMRVRSFNGGSCKYGKTETVKGYTSRAMKYYAFKRKYKQDEKYNKLNRSNNIYIAKIDNEIVINLPHCKIQNGLLEVPYFSNELSFILLSDFDNVLIKKICDFKPQAMIGGEIKSYQEKYIPNFLMQLKLLDIDIYNNFINEYSQYDFEPNYVGKKAKLNTINEGIVRYMSSSYPQFNEYWNWDGEFLTYEKGYLNKPNICKEFEVVEFKIKPNENTVIEISDNEQVNENTEFIDF